MKTINTSSFDFEKVIVNDFLYVDKTAYIPKLLQSSTECFLLRPRRFGKSLLVSMLKALFQGRRELFRGLAIDREDYDWKEYPVIHLDFTGCQVRTAAELRTVLEDNLENFSLQLGVKLRGENYSMRFGNLIDDAAAASPARQVVVLVDEYDKPILDNIANLEHREELRDMLKGFYSNIKKSRGASASRSSPA